MKQRSKWVKKCSKCKKILAPQNKSGLCNHHRMLEWKKTPKGKACIKNYRSRPDVKKKISEYSKRYYIKNKEKMNKYAREYYLKSVTTKE